MSEHQNVKIIAFVGLTGSGKSEAVGYVTTLGYPRVYGGGLIVEGVKQRGLDVTPENEKAYREDMRREHGNDYFIKQVIDQMHHLIDAGQRKLVFDGLYTWTEYKALKHEFPGELTVVAVVAPKHIRHHRLTLRPVRPLTIEEANHRDWAEIENIEKGGPIAIADYYVDNSGDRDALHHAVDDILRHIEF